ncbi:DNA alkylation repair protein [Mariprofundus sp. KV]|uniref:DNA alkylation repair protein n=1 Tax=Mariprofundus sp. KV TaxID=2608715 RepID=UPI0015A38EAA|nr:DNA alkylation repair protein [Mariprofundus sp. KV]NWF36091.1 DNA alkylation repair protein [Mariprofundus sp. KV]
MAEPFKNLFNEVLIDNVAASLVKHCPDFDAMAFKSSVFDAHWQQRELKDRIYHIATSMQPLLPSDYAQAVAILQLAGAAFSGVEYLIFPAYVELFGLDDYEPSVKALEVMTPYSSSELAVRPFIIRYGDRMMTQMERWAESENEHVRRLASEGCRPRLPWAMALPGFKRDPGAVLNIIEKLMDDKSEYVRRSVANNLNDISKDNPDVLIDLLHKRLGKNSRTDWILKHASRSLLKQGDSQVLQRFGFSDPEHVKAANLEVDQNVAIGKQLAFSFQLQTTDRELGKLRIEYAIDFMKANGRQARKIFKVSEADYADTTKTVAKTHSFKLITTRRYYPGRHDLAVIVNGKQLASEAFELLAEQP